MPYTNEPDSDAWKAVRQQIADLLEPFATSFGPRVCGHGDWADCHDCDYGESQPKPGAMPMVKDWVLVVTTEDVAADEPRIEVVQSPGLRAHALNGLLYTALQE